jgi:hypothetical protein
MRSLSLEETPRVVGGQVEAGEDIDHPGPVEPSGDINPNGEPGTAAEIGTDLPNRDNQLA